MYFPKKIFSYLLKNVVAQYDFMFQKAHLKEFGAQPSNSEGGDDDIGIEDYFHRMLLKTSSSVSSPSASAKGSTCLLNCLKRLTER